MDWKQTLIGVGAGVASGTITALLGYAKNNKESFEPKKAVQTIVVGAFVGGVAGYIGVTYTNAEEWLASTGALTMFEYVKKAVWRRIVRK